MACQITASEQYTFDCPPAALQEWADYIQDDTPSEVAIAVMMVTANWRIVLHVDGLIIIVKC